MNPYKQSLTYWAPGASDGYGGIALGSPVALYGRWEERQEEFLDSAGITVLSKAIVFMPQSYKGSVNIGGWLYPGTSVGADPTVLVGAFEIRQLLITPDLRNVKNELRVIL